MRRAQASLSRELRGADGRSETPQGRRKQSIQRYPLARLSFVRSSLVLARSLAHYLNLDPQQCSIMPLPAAALVHRCVPYSSLCVQRGTTRGLPYLRTFALFESHVHPADTQHCSQLPSHLDATHLLCDILLFVYLHRFMPG